ncbi:hypothetical protein VPJ55_17175 [Acinetobacter baumannii]|uniref:hypothetical protein n=1 Tax=Acinetobacter baumannii TaxID=470 RepID=UPI002FDF33D1
MDKKIEEKTKDINEKIQKLDLAIQELIETPDYQEYQTKPYSIYKDPVWNSTTRKKRADLEQITFYGTVANSRW